MVVNLFLCNRFFFVEEEMQSHEQSYFESMSSSSREIDSLERRLYPEGVDLVTSTVVVLLLSMIQRDARGVGVVILQSF